MRDAADQRSRYSVADSSQGNNNNSCSSSATAARPSGIDSNPIMVAVRKRPKIEPREENENDIVRCQSGSVAVYEPRTKLDLTPVIEPSLFSFDHVFEEMSKNIDIYVECCQPLLQTVREGGGAVIFAFGQTGSGKTHTMLGKDGTPGLYGLAVTQLLEMTDSDSLSVSFFEVYGTKLFDLLNDRAPVKMLQDEYKNIHIVGLTERRVGSVHDVHSLMSSGQMLRAVGITHANDRSSRSHAVLEIKVKLPTLSDTFGRMTFVDLAGSERAPDTAETDAKTRREGAEINKSLLALKECIRAMSMRKRHVPFRGSKLTQILRESFTGRCKTCVIATVSPCQSHCEDTLNTLRYADRIKELKSTSSLGVLSEAPVPCRNCGLPIFMGDRHVCRRQVVQCPHCRQEMDKPELEAHIPECKEFPMRCPHCNERMLRGELARHNRRCFRFPVRCSACGQHVPRNLLDKHSTMECGAAKEKCRYCGVVFFRQTLMAHEQMCDAMKIACTFCLQFVRRKGMEAHRATCPMNPNRAKVGDISNANNNNMNGGSPSRARVASRAGSTSLLTPRASVESRDSIQNVATMSPQLQQHTSSSIIDTTDVMESQGGKLETIKYTSVGRLSTNNGGTSRPMSSAPGPGRPLGDDKCECPYTRFGCTTKVSRNNLSFHLADCLRDHLQLVTNYADRVDHENAELRRLVVCDNKLVLPLLPSNERQRTASTGDLSGGGGGGAAKRRSRGGGQ